MFALEGSPVPTLVLAQAGHTASAGLTFPIYKGGT